MKLNGPAAMVWELLLAETPAAQMVAYVADSFDQPVEIVEPLIAATLQRLVDAGAARAA